MAELHNQARRAVGSHSLNRRSISTPEPRASRDLSPRDEAEEARRVQLVEVTIDSLAFAGDAWFTDTATFCRLIGTSG